MSQKLTFTIKFKSKSQIDELLNQEVPSLDNTEIKPILLKVLKAILLPRIKEKVHLEEDWKNELRNVKAFLEGLINNIKILLNEPINSTQNNEQNLTNNLLLNGTSIKKIVKNFESFQ